MNTFSLQQLREEAIKQNKAIKLVLKDLPKHENEITLEPEINSFEYLIDDNIFISKGLIIDLHYVVYAYLFLSKKENKNESEIYTKSKRSWRPIS